MKRQRLILLLPILLVVHLGLWGGSLLQSGSIHAQEPNQATIQDKFEIDFPGGTINEYVQFLRTCPNFDGHNRKTPVNILVTENAKDYQLPEIHVTTNMAGALGLLQSCNSENSEIMVDHASVGDITTIQIFNGESPSVTVINAKALLSNMEEEDLMEVIDAGLSMQGTASTVELRLHQKTGILFAKGTKRATQLVHEIVNELTGNYGFPAGMMGGGMGGAGGGGMGLGGGLGAGGMGPGGKGFGGRGGLGSSDRRDSAPGAPLKPIGEKDSLPKQKGN